MAVGVLGELQSGKLANEWLEKGMDAAVVGRGFQVCMQDAHPPKKFSIG